MGTRTLVSQEEYLKTSFEGSEPDYVDGEVVARSLPNSIHSRTQIRLSDAFKPIEDKRELFRLSEIRLRVATNKFRVVDFALFTSEQSELVPENAPYAVVEIVSPDDGYEDMMIKLTDYEQAGIEFIFIADPPTRKLSRYRHGDLLSASALELPTYGVTIPLTSIFG